MWALHQLGLAFEGAMSKLQGRAKRYDGTAIDYVLLFDWVTGNCLGKAVPNSSGVWTYNHYTDINIGITYVANGCEPITHGAYSLVGSWSPDAVFDGNKTGVFYDPSDLSTLFKDDGGLVPVTTDGDIVKLMLDKSGSNNHARIGAPLITSEGTSIVSGMRYRTDGVLHWLENYNFDSGFIANPIIKSSNFSSFFALKYNDLNDAESQYFQQGKSSPRLVFAATRNADNEQMYAVFNDTYNAIFGALDTNPHIYSNIHNGSTNYLTMQVDNLSSDVFSMLNQFPNKQVDLFRRIKDWNGRFYGAVIVDNLIATTENQDNIKAFLAQKSGITI